MSTEEFSNGFDVILDSNKLSPEYSEAETPITIVLDEYEKSWFLTKAQYQLVEELYLGANRTRTSFEGSEELRSKLRNLINTKILNKADISSGGLSPLSKFFNADDDVLFITYESAILSDDKAGCMNGKEIEIVPITQDEYHRIKKNPFRKATKSRALRLDYGKVDNNLILEVISEYNIKDYTIRYIKKPDPIIVSNLGSDLTIEGKSTRTECALDPSLHNLILERAATLAIASKARGNK